MLNILLQDVGDGLVDEVDDLNGRVDDAELFLLLREGDLEELLEELLDEDLPIFGSLEEARAQLHRFVEIIKRP